MLTTFVSSFRAQFPDLLGARLLVALSGGADSVALLHLLTAARGELGCELLVAHVHHHARGSEADADAEFCAGLCGSLKLDLVRLDIAPGVPRGVSREAFWRDERYRLLERARDQGGCAAVATAHTLDDQAETVLLKLLRGAGPRGVAGIRRRHGAVIRPLLDRRRGELRAWLAAAGLAWREDSSNAALEPPRGFLRHHLLPAISGAFPAAVEQLAAFAGALADDDALLAQLVRESGGWPDPRTPVALAAVAGLPLPLRRRWALELAERLPLAEPPSRRQLAAVEALLSGGQPAAVDLGRRWVLRRRGARLCLSPPPLGPFASVRAPVPSECSLPGGFVARVGLTAATADHRAVLAPRIAAEVLEWRSLRAGERLTGEEKGLVGRLARAGIPAEWRRAWPVLHAGGTMIWAPGAGLARGWAGETGTGVVAELEEPWRRHTRS